MKIEKMSTLRPRVRQWFDGFKNKIKGFRFNGAYAVGVLAFVCIVLFVTGCAHSQNLEGRVSISHKLDGNSGLVGDNPGAGIGVYYRKEKWECGIQHWSHYTSGWPLNPGDDETDLDFLLCSWLIK